jgi:hypothetical protein
MIELLALNLTFGLVNVLVLCFFRTNFGFSSLQTVLVVMKMEEKTKKRAIPP